MNERERERERERSKQGENKKGHDIWGPLL
jgi:hypothetical protein